MAYLDFLLSFWILIARTFFIIRRRCDLSARESDVLAMESLLNSAKCKARNIFGFCELMMWMIFFLIAGAIDGIIQKIVSLFRDRARAADSGSL